MEDQQLTRQIIGCAYAVYNQLGSGFLESVYQKSLLIELQKTGLTARANHPSVCITMVKLSASFERTWLFSRALSSNSKQLSRSTKLMRFKS